MLETATVLGLQPHRQSKQVLSERFCIKIALEASVGARLTSWLVLRNLGQSFAAIHRRTLSKLRHQCCRSSLLRTHLEFRLVWIVEAQVLVADSEREGGRFEAGLEFQAFAGRGWEKLADSEEPGGGALEHANERLVRLLYAALASGDASRVGELVDADLEWWFYGPRREQHMMRLLTGVTTCDTFAFELTSIRGIGNRVFVEGEAPGAARKGGSGAPSKVFWVHIWTVKDKRVTQLREYFNTAILVTDLKPTTPTPHEIQDYPCVPLWQNRLWKSNEGRELPGLILAI